MRTLTVLALLGVVLVGAARADLTAVTGNDYSWVAYNNGLGMYPTLPANTTGFGYDNDGQCVPGQEGLWLGYNSLGGWQPGANTFGNLVSFADGADTGVSMIMSNNTGSDPLTPSVWHDAQESASNGRSYVWINGNSHTATADGVFVDTLGSSISGQVSIIHSHGSVAAYTFSGLDVNATYDFAGIAEAATGGNLSKTSEIALFAGDMNVALADNTFDWNDSILFEGLSPNADGTISISLTNIGGAQPGQSPAFSGIALGAIASAIPGDLDGDGDVDAADVDLLRAGLGDPVNDMDGDGDADFDDMIYLVENYLEWHRSNPGDGVGTNMGDITLDGHVDAVDLAEMKTGFGSAGGWASGNLNTDGYVDLTDLMLLRANDGADVGVSDAPEPATLLILAAGAVGLLRRRR